MRQQLEKDGILKGFKKSLEKLFLKMRDIMTSFYTDGDDLGQRKN